MVSSKSPSSKQQNVGAKRPSSSYNVFFRLERMRILQSSGRKIDDATAATLAPADHYDPLEHPRPWKYADVRLPPYWYSASLNSASLNGNTEVEPKRKHRKCPGRISMGTLSKMISESWRNVDPETKAYCKALANIDARALLFRKHHVKTKSGTEQRTSSNQQFSESVQAKLTYLSNVEDYRNALQPVELDVRSNLDVEQEVFFPPQAGDYGVLDNSFEGCRDIEPLAVYSSNAEQDVFSTSTPQSCDSGLIDNFFEGSNDNNRAAQMTKRDVISLLEAQANPMPEVSPGSKVHVNRNELVDNDHNYSVRADTSAHVPSNLLCRPCSNMNVFNESSRHFNLQMPSCATAVDAGIIDNFYSRTSDMLGESSQHFNRQMSSCAATAENLYCIQDQQKYHGTIGSSFSSDVTCDEFDFDRTMY